MHIEPAANEADGEAGRLLFEHPPAEQSELDFALKS